MIRAFTGLVGVIVSMALTSTPSWAVASRANFEIAARQDALKWVYAYRPGPRVAEVPAAVRAMSRLDIFGEPESGGVYVGFIAGILGSNPDQAEELIGKMLPLPAEHQWALVRAIAYSGLPAWKELLRNVAPGLPARQVMIDKYLAGELPTLEQAALFEPSPSWSKRMRGYLDVSQYFGKQPPKKVKLDANPDVLDTFWGIYFATRNDAPVTRIVRMLPWSTDRNDGEKLTLGSMAKYTLAINAARDGELLGTLKRVRGRQTDAVKPILQEVIDSAETLDLARLHKESLAAIEQFKTKGPQYQRDAALWGKVGEGALGLGCIAAAATGQVALGLPCVIGGAVTSAVVRGWPGQ
jgi:hypothetical protein